MWAILVDDSPTALPSSSIRMPPALKKTFVEEQQLLEDAFRLGVEIYRDGFRPDYLVGLWRGGSTVGIYVQECLQTLGVHTDHIAARTSYRGMDAYFNELEKPSPIRVHGLKYLFDNLSHHNRLLVVDDIQSTGRNIQALLDRLARVCRRNLPAEIRTAAVYYRPVEDGAEPPDYFVHRTADWLVFPYELSGLSRAEIDRHKPWAGEILASCQPDSEKPR